MSYQIVSYNLTLPANYPNMTYIGLQMSNGQFFNMKLDTAERAQQVIDILRNESPVYTDGRGTLYTGKEPIGEGE